VAKKFKVVMHVTAEDQHTEENIRRWLERCFNLAGGNQNVAVTEITLLKPPGRKPKKKVAKT
jgi:hypothetical protein